MNAKNTIKVLVIDDDEDSCNAIKVLLDLHYKYEFKVDDCSSLKEALKINLNNYDIIILDMLLQDSKGVDLYKAISSLTEVPIVIISGYPDLAAEAAQYGAQAYLSKPVSHDLLIQTILFSIEKSKLVNKIKKEKEKFEMVMEGISDAIIIYKTYDGRNFLIINMNKSAEKLENVKRNEVKEMNAEDVFPYIKEFGFDKLFKEVYETGEPKEDHLRKYDDGTWRTNYIYKLPEDDIVNICYNKTNIVKVLKALEEKERMLRCAFNFNRDIIFISDINNKILDRNRSFNKILNYDYKLDKEINVIDIFKEKEKLEEFLLELKENGQNINKEITLLTKDNEEVYCIVSAYILEDKIYYFIHDITKEKTSLNFMLKSKHILSDIIDSKIDDWKSEEDVRIILRKEKINEIDSMIDDIQKFSGE